MVLGTGVLLTRFVGMAFGLSVVAGCGTLQLPDYPTRSTAAHQYHAVGDELALSVHPLVTSREVKKYFGTNLLGKGILPVHFVVENRGATSSFVVADENFSLRDSEADVREGTADGEDPRVGRSAASSGATVAVMSTALVILPVAYLVAVFPVMDAMSDNAEVKRNFVAKQFRIKTISPGESARGFLYFRLPKKRDSPDEWIVRAEIADTGDETRERLDVEFSWKR